MKIVLKVFIFNSVLDAIFSHFLYPEQPLLMLKYSVRGKKCLFTLNASELNRNIWKAVCTS